MSLSYSYLDVYCPTKFLPLLMDELEMASISSLVLVVLVRVMIKVCSEGVITAIY
jgi:hypothetical protein